MDATRPANEVFLTTEEVLEHLQVNLRTVYRLIKAGKIPAVRVGRQWRFRKRDIEAWLDSQGTGPAVPGAAAVSAHQGQTPSLEFTGHHRHRVLQRVQCHRGAEHGRRELPAEAVRRA